MRVVQMHARKHGVRPAIEELQCEVSTGIEQKTVVAKPEPVLGIESIRVPSIDRSHGTCIGSYKRWDGKDTMPVPSMAACQC